MNSRSSSTAFVIVFAVLQFTVKCQEIMNVPDHKKQAIAKPFSRCNGDSNDDSDNNYVQASPPPAGSGLFRDPLEVLGQRYPPTLVLELCSVRLSMYADVISDVKFTVKGTKMCTDICNQYRKTMKFEGPVDVSLLHGYCDYTGTMEKPDGESDLTTTCTCAYKIRCNRRTKMVMYTFQVDCRGFIRVSYTESDQTPVCIT